LRERHTRRHKNRDTESQRDTHTEKHTHADRDTHCETPVLIVTLFTRVKTWKQPQFCQQRNI